MNWISAQEKKAISHSLSVCWLLTFSRFCVPDLWCYISHLNASFKLNASLGELWLGESRVTLRVWESNRKIGPLRHRMSNVLWSRPPFILFIVASSKTLKCPSGGHQPRETAENQEQELNSHKSMAELSKKPKNEDTKRGEKKSLYSWMKWLLPPACPPPPRLNLV